MATDKAQNFDEWFGAFDYEGTALSDRAFAEHAWNAGRASVLTDNAKLHVALMDVWRPVYGSIAAEAKIAALLESKES